MIETLPRREREVFEIVCRLHRATATQVREAMTGAPSDSAVRTLLSRLEARGALEHAVENQAYVYSAATPREAVAKGALDTLVANFFDGSVASAATALLGMSRKLQPDEIDALQAMLDQARERSK